ncbi:MAG: hypothetical protein NCW75_11645 [Phycisphaera sp.]|nr:MAG: hypothetical protein NCW75_11645 [Phycisphaera sp.]
MVDPDLLVGDPRIRALIKSKARVMCCRHALCNADEDDLVQLALIQLFTNAHRYDPGRGTIEAFAIKISTNCFRMELRSRRALKRGGWQKPASIDEELDRQTGFTLATGLSEADGRRRRELWSRSDLKSSDLAEDLGLALDRLTASDRELIEHVAAHGSTATAREWSRRTGKSVARHAIDRERKRISRQLEDLDLG